MDVGFEIRKEGGRTHMSVEEWAVISSRETSPLLTWPTMLVRKSFREDWLSKRLYSGHQGFFSEDQLRARTVRLATC